MSGVVDASPLIPKAFRWTSLAPPACLLFLRFHHATIQVFELA